ncbi:DUF7344 domain-containing protein [Halorussus halophilus]|uniref:DUF7344 domain-containing protein n=1 Tax=Halorussus halophilus TaxID=2650975 RepID=UPI001CE46BF5|nr:hypothetical protein [Halorussus halophilus]
MSDKSKPERQGEATNGVSSVSEHDSLETPEIDVLLEALADQQRRCILEQLVEADDGVATFSELIDRVLATSRGPNGSRERVATSLHHRHLPKLADAGLVEYDARSETARYRGDAVTEQWLELAIDHE